MIFVVFSDFFLSRVFLIWILDFRNMNFRRKKCSRRGKSGIICFIFCFSWSFYFLPLRFALKCFCDFKFTQVYNEYDTKDNLFI